MAGHAETDGDEPSVAAVLAYVEGGDWAEGLPPGSGPMSFAYNAATGRVEVTMPSAAAEAARRLLARYPDSVEVTFDDGMMRRR